MPASDENLKIIDVTGCWFSGGDLTDDRVLWVAARSKDDVLAAISGVIRSSVSDTGMTVEAEGRDSVDFFLPDDQQALRDKLQFFLDYPPTFLDGTPPLDEFQFEC